MIDRATAATASALLETFLMAEHCGALPVQLPELIVLLGRALLVTALDLAAAESDLVAV